MRAPDHGQIAVNMRLIDYPAAVTAAEAAHGHRVTYSIDTLRADLRETKLCPVTGGGDFFEGLADFQIDSAQQRRHYLPRVPRRLF